MHVNAGADTRFVYRFHAVYLMGQSLSHLLEVQRLRLGALFLQPAAGTPSMIGVLLPLME